MVTTDDKQPKVRLSRGRVLQAAIHLADEHGIDSLTMRKLAESLGVEAMSIYHHLANKEALLDGIVDSLIGEIEHELGGFDVELDPAGWKTTIRNRILTARRVMLRHKWAPALIETRSTMTPTLLRYFNGLLGIMVEGGFSYDLGHHAMHALGSRGLGFNQELFEPDDPNEGDEQAGSVLAEFGPQIPYLVAMLTDVSHSDGADETLGWCDDQTEFVFGLDLILDGLDAKL